jgi:hypothetical protein
LSDQERAELSLQRWVPCSSDRLLSELSRRGGVYIAGDGETEKTSSK